MRLQADKSKGHHADGQSNPQRHRVSHRGEAVARRHDRKGSRRVHSWIGNGGNQFTKLVAAPPSAPVPATLAWDLWIGTAPQRDFAPERLSPVQLARLGRTSAAARSAISAATFSIPFSPRSN
jgi:hypothetical protein